MNFFKQLFKNNSSKKTTDSSIKNSINNYQIEDKYIRHTEPSEEKNFKNIEFTEKEKDELIDQLARDENDFLSTYIENLDPVIEDAARLIVQSQIGSTSLLQRRMKLGYNRAERLMDQLEYIGVVGVNQGSRVREVLIKDEAEFEHFLQTQFRLFKIDIQAFYEDYKSEIERRKLEYQEQKEQQQIQYEKSLIRQNFLEKGKKRQLQREVYKVLLDKETISNQSIEKGLSREPIPQDIMDKVWNRDGGKCVKCGSQENLEFDHIIPFSKGGANTYRNLQILCKKCNIEKSNKIG